MPPPPVVSVVAARRMTVPIMAEPIGTTRALEEVSIRARVRGVLDDLHFAEGGDFKAGQLLFVIDVDPFKAKQVEAQVALELAEASLKKAKDSKAREVATEQLELSRAALKLAEVEEWRVQNLFKRVATSIEDVQRKQAIHQKDAAQVDADKASLEQAGADFDTDILAAQAEVPNPGATIPPAECVKADVKVGETKDAIVVPEQTVIETQAGPTVFTVDGAGKVAVVQVGATFIYQGLCVLESGLEPDLQVIVEGMQFVRGGQTVKIAATSPETPRKAESPATAKETLRDGDKPREPAQKP
ncbi:efflux RND transporter periplasmic adaptor subunit [Singulisphaera sp. PoT]|uniref:efflux RND transporter periplasmic adaptor subunit n=1 Tax=Singulisphaera sp. PoT TaxID=3411797 RepID=UPI003BF55CC0